jgi:pimeloyl-ACP methyl ester carboxylesterase
MACLELNGTSLEYSEVGKGEPLVLVHGSASDYRTWYKQQDEFAEQYRVITYSRRYHWPNDRIPEDADYSMLEHVDDLTALIVKLNAEPAHLIGHSYGAYVCLLLAIQEPQLVRTLVLAEPPAITLFVSNKPKPGEILKLLMTRPRTATAIISFGAKGVTPAETAAKRNEVMKAMRLFGKTILGEQYYRKLSKQRLEQVDTNSIKAEFLGSGFAPLACDQVRNVNIPTLLVNGKHSHRLFHCLVDRLEELLPQTERIEIAQASHIMHEDNAQAYNQAVTAFLEKHGRGA